MYLKLLKILVILFTILLITTFSTIIKSNPYIVINVTNFDRKFDIKLDDCVLRNNVLICKNFSNNLSNVTLILRLGSYYIIEYHNECYIYNLTTLSKFRGINCSKDVILGKVSENEFIFKNSTGIYTYNLETNTTYTSKLTSFKPDVVINATKLDEHVKWSLLYKFKHCIDQVVLSKDRLDLIIYLDVRFSGTYCLNDLIFDFIKFNNNISISISKNYEDFKILLTNISRSIFKIHFKSQDGKLMISIKFKNLTYSFNLKLSNNTYILDHKVDMYILNESLSQSFQYLNNTYIWKLKVKDLVINYDNKTYQVNDVIDEIRGEVEINVGFLASYLDIILSREGFKESEKISKYISILDLLKGTYSIKLPTRLSRCSIMLNLPLTVVVILIMQFIGVCMGVIGSLLIIKYFRRRRFNYEYYDIATV